MIPKSSLSQHRVYLLLPNLNLSNFAGTVQIADLNVFVIIGQLIWISHRATVAGLFFFFGVWSNFNKLKTPDQ